MMGQFSNPEGMTYATKEDWESWPKPNFVNPESRKPLVLGVEVTLTSIAALVVVSRFYARTFIKHVLGWDDWLMMGAMMCAITITILHCLCTQYALGLHLWDIKSEWTKPTAMLTYVSLTLFAPVASLAKISLCLTHLRILPSASDRNFARCAIVFSICYCVSFTLTNIFQCWPIRAYWAWQVDEYICVHERPFNYAQQALNSASDFLIFLWPIRTLWTVRVPVKQRLMLVFFFSIGAIVCIAGVFRAYYLYRYFHSYDYFWEGAIIFILHNIEVNVAIICGCLPGIKPLLGRLFPKAFGSSIDHNAYSFSHCRLPGARLSIRTSCHVPTLTHRPSTASMVEVPIKLDHSWAPIAIPAPVALGILPEPGILPDPPEVDHEREMPSGLEPVREPRYHEPHPGTRVISV